jgi:murein L,D-transpeptidase YcbB/YkuD
LPDPNTHRARVVVYGMIAVPALCAAALAGAIPLTGDPGPQRWTRPVAASLLTYIERMESHGLEPDDYAPDALRQAIRSGDDAELERQATQSFGLVAGDLANGHVPSAQRRQFHIARVSIAPARVAVLIDEAIATKDPAGVLGALAPADPQYAALRNQLDGLEAGDDIHRRKLEASLERWRWMPRDVPARRLLVNIPEYRLRVIADGAEIASHRVIVGKPQTPTPQFTAQVTGIILNPTWGVPQSIIRESVGSLVRNNPSAARARGFTWSNAGGSLRVTQQPGPGNALGQLKLDMPNPFTVFVHDTSNRDLFEREVRTLSHGCIRADKPFDLAALLLAGSTWNRARIAEVVGSRKTTRVPLEASIPLFTVYMTAFVMPDGGVRYFDDPYRLDPAVNRLLDDRQRG